MRFLVMDPSVHVRKRVICASNAWKCMDNKFCIRQSSLCDGKPDCEDKSDEKYCDSEGKVELPIERVVEVSK